MGRELRLVTAKWEPHEEPLFDGMNFVEYVREFAAQQALWRRGIRRVYGRDHDYAPKEERYDGMPFEEWYGAEPLASDYTPCRPWMEVVGMVMYENTSEGTPMSPMFPLDQKDELAQWLVDNNASAFGSMTATKEQWLATIEAGYAVDLISTSSKGCRTGVAFNAEETT